MGYRYHRFPVLVVLFTLVFEVSAEVVLKTLQHNPFNRPDIVRVKPVVQKPVQKTIPVPDKLDLELTATMVSESAPMVVVDGRLLGIGEKIKGYQLIAVTEGGAVFVHRGKKYSLTVAEDDDESISDD